MKKMFCFALVLTVSSFAWPNRSEKLKRSIEKRQKTELKRGIAKERKKTKAESKDL